jgi:hypothetical protein
MICEDGCGGEGRGGVVFIFTTVEDESSGLGLPDSHDNGCKPFGVVFSIPTLECNLFQL